MVLALGMLASSRFREYVTMSEEDEVDIEFSDMKPILKQWTCPSCNLLYSRAIYFKWDDTKARAFLGGCRYCGLRFGAQTAYRLHLKIPMVPW